MKCDQCEMLSINGVACHETGCPNADKRKFFTSKSGQRYAMFQLSEIEESREEYTGFCIRCGMEKGGVEPDARKYECDECGKRTVYGGEQIVLEFPELILTEE